MSTFSPFPQPPRSPFSRPRLHARRHDNTIQIPRVCPSGAAGGHRAGGNHAGAPTSDVDEDGGAPYVPPGGSGGGRGGGRGRDRGGKRGGGGGGREPQGCTNRTFVEVLAPGSESGGGGLGGGDLSVSDYQELRLEEHVSTLAVGAIPRSVTVALEDDLIDSGAPLGDDVVISGVVVFQWPRMKEGKRCELDAVLKANHVERPKARTLANVTTAALLHDFAAFWHHFTVVLNRPLAARDVLIRSVCPNLHGCFTPKLALLMSLIGGVTSTPRDASGGEGGEGSSGGGRSGHRTRGDSHLLLIGDPGTGKSQLLAFAHKLSPRAVMTTGTGSTKAGLTAAVSMTKKDTGDESELEAGALVLADGGVCCIDEFAQLGQEDQDAIHEAMEQQKIHFSKGGIVTDLNTRCTIVAGCNPRGGRYDFGKSTSDNTGECDADRLSPHHVHPSPCSTLPHNNPTSYLMLHSRPRFPAGIAVTLLSRFDMVLTLLDPHDLRWDASLASHILSAALHRGGPYAATAGPRTARLDAAALADRAGPGGSEAILRRLERYAALASADAESEACRLDAAAAGGGVPDPINDLVDAMMDSVVLGSPAALRMIAVRADSNGWLGGGGGGGGSSTGTRVEEQGLAPIEMDPHGAMQGGSAPQGGDDGDRPLVIWAFERLQAYVQTVKRLAPVTISPAAGEVMKAYFVSLRQNQSQPLGQSGRGLGESTNRLAQAILRLTQAHARMCFRTRAVLQDAVVAISLIDACYVSCVQPPSRDEHGNVLGSPVSSSFLPDPDGNYASLEVSVIGALGLAGLVETEQAADYLYRPEGWVPPWEEGGAGGGAGGAVAGGGGGPMGTGSRGARPGGDDDVGDYGDDDADSRGSRGDSDEDDRGGGRGGRDPMGVGRVAPGKGALHGLEPVSDRLAADFDDDDDGGGNAMGGDDADMMAMFGDDDAVLDIIRHSQQAQLQDAKVSQQRPLVPAPVTSSGAVGGSLAPIRGTSGPPPAPQLQPAPVKLPAAAARVAVHAVSAPYSAGAPPRSSPSPPPSQRLDASALSGWPAPNQTLATAASEVSGASQASGRSRGGLMGPPAPVVRAPAVSSSVVPAMAAPLVPPRPPASAVVLPAKAVAPAALLVQSQQQQQQQAMGDSIYQRSTQASAAAPSQASLSSLELSAIHSQPQGGARNQTGASAPAVPTPPVFNRTPIVTNGPSGGAVPNARPLALPQAPQVPRPAAAPVAAPVAAFASSSAAARPAAGHDGVTRVPTAPSAPAPAPAASADARPAAGRVGGPAVQAAAVGDFKEFDDLDDDFEAALLALATQAPQPPVVPPPAVAQRPIQAAPRAVRQPTLPAAAGRGWPLGAAHAPATMPAPGGAAPMPVVGLPGAAAAHDSVLAAASASAATAAAVGEKRPYAAALVVSGLNNDDDEVDFAGLEDL